MTLNASDLRDVSGEIDPRLPIDVSMGESPTDDAAPATSTEHSEAAPAPIPEETATPAPVPQDDQPPQPISPPATVEDKPMLCSKCGRPIEQDHFETVLVEGSTEPEYVCGACLNGTVKPAPAPETKPASSPEHPADKLIETVKEAVRLRSLARRFELKDVDAAITEAVDAIVANLETGDAGDWKAYGNLRKTLDSVIAQGRSVIDEHTRRERTERLLVAQRVRGIFGLKQTNMDLVSVQQARGKNGEPASAETSVILGRMPIEKRETPPDEPCATPGCKGMVSGDVIASWNRPRPKSGLRCRPCYYIWKAKQAERRHS